jgi:hypothetical protein
MTSSSRVADQNKDQTAAAEAPDFATEVHKFWEKNRTLVLALCAAILLGIMAYEGLRYFNAMRDLNAQEDFAKTAGAPDRLAGFAAEHSGHVLASVALLQLADAKYAAGDYSAALTGYQQAVSVLTNPTLKARARLGAAVSKLGAGDQTTAGTELKVLSGDVAVDKTIRAEAGYHLATLASEAGRTDEVRQLLDEVTKLDGFGIWGQRALQLRASLMLESVPALSLKPQQ